MGLDLADALKIEELPRLGANPQRPFCMLNRVPFALRLSSLAVERVGSVRQVQQKAVMGWLV